MPTSQILMVTLYEEARGSWNVEEEIIILKVCSSSLPNDPKNRQLFAE